MGQGDGDRVHDAEEVDVGGVDEVHRIELFSECHRQNARVGHDDVELAEIGDAGLERVAQLVSLADVGDPGEHAAAEFLDRPLDLGQVVGRCQRVRVGVDVPADVDDDDVGALPGHRERVRTSLTTGPTCDESDLALEPSSHLSSADRTPFSNEANLIYAGLLINPPPGHVFGFRRRSREHAWPGATPAGAQATGGYAGRRAHLT